MNSEQIRSARQRIKVPGKELASISGVAVAPIRRLERMQGGVGTARALRRFRGFGRRVAWRQLVPLSRAPVFGCVQGQGCPTVRRCDDQNQAIGRTENC